jgi:hypothetical protein
MPRPHLCIFCAALTALLALLLMLAPSPALAQDENLVSTVEVGKGGAANGQEYGPFDSSDVPASSC